MLSIYLHHIIGFSSKASRIFPSKSAIYKIAYGGANFVPIAVQEILRGFHLRFACYPSVPKIFEENSDLHYVECWDKDQKCQYYTESLISPCFLIYLKNGSYP